MKRTLLAGIAAAVAAIAAVSASLASPAANSPIVIGRAIALTGFVKAYDGPTMVAEDMAAADINAHGGIMGHPIKFVTADTKSDIAQGGNAAQEVISKGAQVMIVTCDYDYGGAAARVAQQKNILAVSTCAESPKFGVQGIGPLAFSLGNGTPGQAAVAAEFLATKFKRFYILDDPTIEYDRTLCSYFKRRAQELHVQIVGEDTFQNSDPSIATQINRIRSANPDLIFMCSYPPGGASAFKQIRGAGIQTAIASGDGFDGNYWFGAVGDVSHWYVAAEASIWGDDRNPQVNDFFKRYKQKTGQAAPASFAITGYSAVQVIKRAIELASKKAGAVTYDGSRLAHALETLRGFPTLIGPTTFTPKLHLNFTRPMAIIEVEHNKGHLVQYWSPHHVPPISFK